ncbi:MAG: L-threonylcarbamoyladenylate synthase [Alphaproteobacteria bacterium]|nr:L-threonylcarbamoyladenylate synthase [Alphaproteobacteria bacterium]
MKLVHSSPEAIKEAATLLRKGRLVAFPTETVYGLGADATNDHAIAAVYAAKGRPVFNPLIVHLPDTRNIDKLVVWNETAQKLADKFWPGPLTLILPRALNCSVSLLASAGLNTLAVRVPSHPVALDLLNSAGLPIAAPSANASGKLSPTTPEHVAESLGDSVDMILDGGKTSVGVESTVLDLTGSRPMILRYGGIAPEQLEEITGSIDLPSSSENIKSPGMMTSHYAPDLFVRLNADSASPDEALLCFGEDAHIKGGAERLNLSKQGDLNEAAANLFSMLRALDKTHHRAIAVMPIPNTGLGMAINDRLRRAAAPRD